MFPFFLFPSVSRLNAGFELLMIPRGTKNATSSMAVVLYNLFIISSGPFSESRYSITEKHVSACVDACTGELFSQYVRVVAVVSS